MNPLRNIFHFGHSHRNWRDVHPSQERKAEISAVSTKKGDLSGSKMVALANEILIGHHRLEEKERMRREIKNAFSRFNMNSVKQNSPGHMILQRIREDSQQDIAKRLEKIGSDFWRTAAKTKVVDGNEDPIIFNAVEEGMAGGFKAASSEKMKEIFAYFYTLYSNEVVDMDTFGDEYLSSNTAAGLWLIEQHNQGKFSNRFLQFLFTRSQTNTVGCLQEVINGYGKEDFKSHNNCWVKAHTNGQAHYTLLTDQKTGYLESRIEFPLEYLTAENGSVEMPIMAITKCAYSIFYDSKMRPVQVFSTVNDEIEYRF